MSRRLYPSLRHPLIACAAAWMLFACASTARPPALDASAKAHESSETLRRVAPLAVAHADQLQASAEDALGRGETELAQLLAEQALVAYQRAELQAQSVRSAARQAAAEKALVELRGRLAELDRRQTETAAETRALELRVKVVRDAEPRLDLEPTNPKREAERRSAGLAVASEAALLCEAARLLAPQQASVGPALDALRQLRDAAPKTTGSKTLDAALDSRVRCLTELTRARRSALPGASEADADRFLEQLATAVPSGRVYRDDRGTVLAVAPYERGKLSSAATQAFRQLSEVAKANPGVPLMAVLHSSRGGVCDPAVVAKRPSADCAPPLQAAFNDVGLSNVVLQVVSDYSPLPPGAQRLAVNPKDYVEFVFVTR